MAVDLGRLIVKALKESKKPISTYEIAKKLNVSWATANIHCYKLLSDSILSCKAEEVKINSKRIVWWVK